MNVINWDELINFLLEYLFKAAAFGAVFFIAIIAALGYWKDHPGLKPSAIRAVGHGMGILAVGVATLFFSSNYGMNNVGDRDNPNYVVDFVPTQKQTNTHGAEIFSQYWFRQF
jgi:hypothetical protein